MQRLDGCRISESKEIQCVNRKQSSRVGVCPASLGGEAAHLNQVPSFVYVPVYCIACLFVWVFSFGPPSQHFPVVCVGSCMTSPLRSGHRTSLKGTSDAHCLEPRPVWDSAISGAASCISSAIFNWNMLFYTLYSKWKGVVFILM